MVEPIDGPLADVEVESGNEVDDNIVTSDNSSSYGRRDDGRTAKSTYTWHMFRREVIANNTDIEVQYRCNCDIEVQYHGNCRY